MINTVGAGKGHLPRRVNGEAFRNNHDDIFRKEKTRHSTEGHSTEGSEERVLPQTQERELATHAESQQGD